MEVLDVLDSNLTNKEFKERLSQIADYSREIKPLRACDHCNGYYRVTDRPVAKQVDHKMDPYEK